MGVLKHSLQKKQHRERSQPQHRKKFGLLEKHKDYVQRAKDFHSKESRINVLKRKAAGRNKDEFYFAMLNSGTKGGVHIQSRGNQVLTPDEVKLLKTQDIKYVQTARSVEERAIQKLRDEIGSRIDLDFNGDSEKEGSILDLLQSNKPTDTKPTISKGKKTVFVDEFDDIKESEIHSSSEKKKGESIDETNELSDEDIDSNEGHDDDDNANDNTKKLIEELKSRIDRHEKLRRVEQEMEHQKTLMGRGAKHIVKKSKKRGELEESSDEEDGPTFDRGGKGIDKAQDKVWKWRKERRR